MADELRGIENSYKIRDLPGPTQIVPYEPIRPENGYQMQLDPMLQASIGGASEGEQGLQLGNNPMAGWYESPDQGGLGVAGRGPAPDRQESLDEHFARQIFPDFKGELSFGDKLRLRDGMMNSIPHMASRQEQIASQAAKLEEEKFGIPSSVKLAKGAL
jgi:hypothetical protein